VLHDAPGFLTLDHQIRLSFGRESGVAGDWPAFHSEATMAEEEYTYRQELWRSTQTFRIRH